MARILIVLKTPLAQRLPAADLERIIASGVSERAVLIGAQERHLATLATVQRVFAADEVETIRVENIRAGQEVAADLVVTVGGDGTVFTAAALRTAAPFLTVNSDPVRSLGNFARATADTVEDLVARWRAGTAGIERLPRLEVQIGPQRWPFLNDCLFTNPNPAAMCRYLIETPTGRSVQRSSGVWVSTAAGSTGAIRSAGMEPEKSAHALLFKVREPFQPPADAELEGRQTPPRWLRLIPSGGGAVCYLDGPNLTVPVSPGEMVTIASSPRPLVLVTR
jgi:NAD+ kinase